MQQMTFEWDSAPKVLAISLSESTVPTKPEPEVTEPAVQPARLPASAPRRPLRDAVEQYLTDRKIPYVDVNEAKRALFASTSSAAFISWPTTRTPAPIGSSGRPIFAGSTRLDMAEWEKVFGEGFVAVVAKEKPSGELTFMTLASEPVEIA